MQSVSKEIIQNIVSNLDDKSLQSFCRTQPDTCDDDFYYFRIIDRYGKTIASLINGEYKQWYLSKKEEACQRIILPPFRKRRADLHLPSRGQ